MTAEEFFTPHTQQQKDTTMLYAFLILMLGGIALSWKAVRNVAFEDVILIIAGQFCMRLAWDIARGAGWI